MEGFKTCADVEKAEAEGAFTLYSTDPEAGQVKLLAPFNKMFPKIKTTYVRLQAGALYAKILSERQAKSFLADVIQLSDMGMILDFQRRKGFRQYISPEMSAYKASTKSQPEGFWTWGAVIMAGIAYNPKVVSEAEAPKKWEDLLDPKWKDSINVKVSNSGLQHGVWYTLKPILGEDYFKKFAGQQPRAFDSYVQQYGRLVDGQDKIIMGAQYSGYIEFKAKGAPLAFVFPQTGVPAVPETYGIVSDGPHPNAAELFMDWFLSPLGQKALSEALLLHSPREDMPAPGGGVALKDMKLLVPADWDAFEKDRPSFAKEWNRIVGARR
jgi:iron(III) transport system substrate-binding protein